jgi:hypothetical protein
MIPDNLHIVKSEYIDGYTIQLSFSDNSTQNVDFGDFLLKHPHPQYDKYRNIALFKKYKTTQFGDIYWGKHWDLAFPVENLYFNNLEKNYEYMEH